jgi:tetratricopeptide (TPR) repeat protein
VPIIKKNTPAGWILLMLLCCTLAYINHFFNAFHFDDFHTIVNNAYIRNLRNIPLFFKDGSTSSVLPANQSYRPVVTTSLAIDYWLGGGYNEFFFHLGNFLLFLLQGVGMVYLFRKIFNAAQAGPSNIYFAIAAAAWYLLHPAMAETVNYIIARSDIISTVFVIVSFLLYIYSPFFRKTGLYLIGVVIGALAKPSAVMFAPMLLLYILFFEEGLGFADVFKRANIKRSGRALLRSLPAFIVCAAVYELTDKLTPKTWIPGGHSAMHYLITQPFVILHYFYMFFFPEQLSVDSDWTPLSSMWDIRFFAGCLFILALLVIIFITSVKQKLRPISFGICWFLLALAPTSSIIPLAEVLNDHRMYFPFVGLMLSAAWAIKLVISRYLPAHKNRIIAAAAVILVCYATGTWQRNNVWHSEESLWRDATIKSPGNGRAWMNYGVAQMGNNELKGAGASFIKAKGYMPAYDLVEVNLGILKQIENDTAKAEEFFKSAIAINPNDASARYFYGRFLYNQMRLKEAAGDLATAMSISPGDLQTRLLLMEVYAGMTDWTDLQGVVQSSARLFPGDTRINAYSNMLKLKENEADQEAVMLAKYPTAAGYIDLSLMYYRAGQFDKCIAACNKALSLKPGYDLAYNNICASYNKLGQWELAIQAGEQGLKANANNTLLKNNLAEALAGKLKMQAGKKRIKLSSVYFWANTMFARC